MKKNRIVLCTGIFFLALSLIFMILLSFPTLGERTVSFASTYKSDPVTLKATYWQGTQDYAVLICPGYSCDRQQWRPIADVFVANGYTTMTFDYSGQGASSGTIGFDNAKTDAIPVQISDAIEKLHDLSGIDYSHIILMGHSMGGRSIIRLLDDFNNPNAQTTVTRRDIGNVILFSTEVNYHFNAQASLFAGTSDESEEPWHSLNASSIIGTNVYLYGSTSDDIVSDEDVLAIYSHLGGTDVPESGIWEKAQVNSVGFKITIGVTSGVLHSQQMYSPKFVTYLNQALTDISGIPASYPPAKISLVYAGWFKGLISLFLTLLTLNNTASTAVQDALPVLTDAKVFLIRKVLMWIPGILAAFLLCCITVVMPFGSPL